MNVFAHRHILFVALLTVGMSACNKDDNNPTTQVTTDGPAGATTTLRTGTLTAENGTPTAGTVSTVRDVNGVEWLQLGQNFKSDFGTGTVTAYLAKTGANIKTQRTKTDGSPNGLGNVQAVGFVQKNGQQYLKLSGSPTPFSYVVMYCETVEINFGNAQLK